MKKTILTLLLLISACSLYADDPIEYIWIDYHIPSSLYIQSECTIENQKYIMSFHVEFYYDLFIAKDGQHHMSIVHMPLSTFSTSIFSVQQDAYNHVMVNIGYYQQLYFNDATFTPKS